MKYSKIKGKVPTKKIKITCSSELHDKIIGMIDDSGEFANISDYAISASKFLLNDYFTYFLPALWNKMESMGYKYGDPLANAAKIKPKSKFNDKKISFQASMPIGLINSYSDAVVCSFNMVEFSELIRFALEYYFDAIYIRRVDAHKALSSRLMLEDFPVFMPKKPVIEFE